MAKKKKLTLVKLSVLVKSTEGKLVEEIIELPIKHAENLLSMKRKAKSWKLADDKFILENGSIKAV